MDIARKLWLVAQDAWRGLGFQWLRDVAAEALREIERLKGTNVSATLAGRLKGRMDGLNIAIEIIESMDGSEWASHSDAQRRGCVGLQVDIILEKLRRAAGRPGKVK